MGTEPVWFRLISNPDFSRSIRLISAVSGGTVGAMYFLESYYRSNDAPGTPQLNLALAAARTPSLGAVGWGFVYPDLMRLLVPLHIIPNDIDRGWALEEAWRWDLPDPDGTPHRIDSRLSDWRARARAGRLPDVIFNSTTVESGKPLIMGTIESADLANPEPSDVFGSAGSSFSGLDLNVATAARLASTFPYVTPVSRADYTWEQPLDEHDPRASHFADGGYFDNFGVYSAVQWLRHRMAQPNFNDKVIIVQIRAFGAAPKKKSSQPFGQLFNNGWVDELLGPPKTILSARESTQTVSDDQEIGLLESKNSNIEDFVFQPPPGTEQPPRSWMLSTNQLTKIDEDWCSPLIDQTIDKLATAWQGPRSKGG